MSDRYKGAILSPTAPTVIPQSAGGVYTLSQQLQYQGQGVWPPAISYPVNNSLRFRSSASAYLNRTPASAGNRQKWTWSGWVKRGALSSGSYMDLFTALSGANDFTEVRYHFNTNDDTLVFTDIAGGVTYAVYSTNVYRDASAWYHIVCSVDTTQATNTNRVKLYVNGVQITQNAGGSGYPLQNTNTSINATVEHRHGGIATYGRYFDGYMAEINFIDGQALTPSSFGTTDAYGIWQPIPYTGAYGTNGFYLPFTDNSALTTTTNVGLGKDFSGNGNYWTTNNISITAGSTYDSMKDVPTNTNSNTANYPTLNPLSKSSSSNISGGNLNWSSSAYNYQGATSTTALPSSGKWYWETFITTGGTATSDDMGIGVQALSFGTAPKDNGGGSGITNGAVIVSRRDSGSRLVVNNSTVQSGTLYSFTTNDIIQVAFDADSGKIWFGKNNSYFDASGGTTGNPGSGTNQVGTLIAGSSYLPVWDGYTNTYVVAVNFGQRPFSYTPPSGFYPLNTYNIPTPTILDGDQYMDATLYTGTSATQSITNAAGFKPDFVWMKSRSNAQDNYLLDSVRGATKDLYSNLTNAETTNANSLTSFNSNGYTLGSGGANFSPYTYVGWQWQAGQGTTSSNTNGSITSTVSANTTAGFSIVTWTGNGSTATIGHGLGVAPSMIIEKVRSTTGGWPVYHASLGNTGAVQLESTGAFSVTSAYWNNTSPTSSVFTVASGINANATTYVAYCFSAVAGYSAFGSYTGNGSTDGPFVFTGFRPKFILIKRSDAAGGWKIYNTSGLNYNPINTSLETNDSAAEATSTSFNMDWLSNGFKIRTTYADFNTSGGTYIYMAFAENPFKIANAR